MLEKLYIENSDKFIEYYSTENIFDITKKYKTIVILVHGTDRNAEDYFNTFVNILNMLNISNQTLLICPHLKIETDSLSENELFWSNSGWKIGNMSQNKNGMRFSSFDVIDNFINILNLGNYCPVKVIGHSAGGQFVHRYGIFGNYINTNLKLTFIPMNPSSYLYFDKMIAYKYGLDDLNSYCIEKYNTDLVNRLNFQRIFAGEMDTYQDDNFDDSVEAMAQGFNRYVRAINYYSCYKTSTDIDINTVKNVGHSHVKMLNSLEFLQYFIQEFI